MRIFHLPRALRPIVPRALIIASLLFLTILGTTASHVQAQSRDYRTLFSDAEYYFLFNDFQEALPLYLQALELMPKNMNLHYRIGRCYLNISGNKHKAIPYLEKAVQAINPSYQEGSYRENGTPVNSYFFLGEAYRIQNRLDEAIEIFNLFKDRLDTKDVYNLDYVNQQISACERAINMMESPLNISINPISLFDTKRYILGPVISGDGNTLLFTAQEKFYNAVYVSIKNSIGDWDTPQNITLDLGVEGELFTTSINNNGTELYLFKNDKGVGNIYTSKKLNDKWSKVQRVDKPFSSRSWETHASISNDGQTLLFSSNRRGGYGGLDLYYSKRLPSGSWGEAVNFGATINTAYNEESPFLSPDGKTLYFVSQGHNSMGGYDIFYSEQVGENEWSTPTNIGYPINSTDDDLSYYPLGSDKGIITKVEFGNPGVRQICIVNILPKPEQIDIDIIGTLELADNSVIISEQFTIELIDFDKTKIQKTKPETSTGKFTLKAYPGTFNLTAKGQGYSTRTVPIAISRNYSQSEYPVNIKLVPETISSGEFISIRSIFFEFDSASLNRDALFEAEKIYNILTKYPALHIEITGHTDTKGTAAYNQVLSLRRAQSVIDFLIDKGIKSERLIARGASFLENIAINHNPDGTDNPEGRSLNRRVTVKVLKSEIDITITSEIDVPEHLKPRDQKYTIMLAPINTAVDSKQLNLINQHSNHIGKKLTGSGNRFAFIVGSFEHKSNAIELLNYAIDNGFAKATIIGEDDLNKLISRSVE